jgi:hypothetical protein
MAMPLFLYGELSLCSFGELIRDHRNFLSENVAG